MSLPGRRLGAWRSSWAVHLLPGALLAAAVLVVAWPQAGTWTGSGRDLGLWVWRDWWFRLMMGDLLAGRTPPVESLEILLTGGVGPNLFSPVDLYLFSLPSWLVGTGAAAWNLKVALVLAANAVGGYILGLAVARDRWAALLAGALMAFNPTVLGLVEGGDLRDALWVFPALFVASLFHLENSDERPRSWLASATLAGCFLTTWLQGLLALVALCLLAGSGTLPHLRSHLWTRLVGLVPGLLVAAFFHGPLLGSILEGAYPFSWPAPLAGPLEPQMPGGHRVLHQSSLPLDFLARPQHPEGLNPLLLLLLVLPLARGIRGWYLVALAGLLLVGGPCLRLGPGGHPLQVEGSLVPLPFLLLYRWVPGMTWVQSPGWFAPLLYLGLAGLGARNLAALKTWFEEHAFLVPLVVLVVAGVTALDAGHRGSLPLSHVRLAPPALYVSLDPRAGGLIESPGTGDRKILDFYQASTGLVVLAGPADREALPGLSTPAARTYQTPVELADLPLLRHLMEPGRFPLGPDPRGDLDTLRQAGYSTVVLHESRLGGLASGPRTFLRLMATLGALVGPPVLGVDPAVSLQSSPSRGLPKGRLAVFSLGKGSAAPGANGR